MKRHQLDPRTDRCHRCGLTSEDIMRLPHTLPHCEPEHAKVDKFMAQRIRARR